MYALTQECPATQKPKHVMKIPISAIRYPMTTQEMTMTMMTMLSEMMMSMMLTQEMMTIMTIRKDAAAYKEKSR